jgi:delta-aminolevulinic acid dehydratase/porphobilinogen synthase
MKINKEIARTVTPAKMMDGEIGEIVDWGRQ